MYSGAEKTSNDPNKPASRFVGTNNIVKVFSDMTPGERTKQIVKRVVKEATDQKKDQKKDQTSKFDKMVKGLGILSMLKYIAQLPPDKGASRPAGFIYPKTNAESDLSGQKKK
jgi:hypothetical protein